MKEYRTPFVSAVGPAFSIIQGGGGGNDDGGIPNLGFTAIPTNLEEQ